MGNAKVQRKLSIKQYFDWYSNLIIKSCGSLVEVGNTIELHFNSILNDFHCISSYYSGGLNPGDIVTHINGKEVHNTSDIYSFLSEKGKALNMIIYRGTKRLEVMIVPEELDD